MPHDVCVMAKGEGILGLIVVETKGSILVAKWVIICLEGSSSW